MELTRKLLSTMVEQPEPSVDGDWYVVHLDDLRQHGNVIEIHFDTDSDRPNAVQMSDA